MSAVIGKAPTILGGPATRTGINIGAMDVSVPSIAQRQHTTPPGAAVAIRTRGGGGGAAAVSGSTAHSQPHPISSSNKTSASSTSNSSSSRKSSVVTARLCLVVTAALFGTLNVCLRQVYALPNPPAPPVVGLIRGVFTALCFAPSLLRMLMQSCGNIHGSCNATERRQQEDGLFRAAFWLGTY